MNDTPDEKPAREPAQNTEETAEPSPETLIQFPAQLSVKAMGLNSAGFIELVESLVVPHVPGDNAITITEVASRNDKYVSVRAHFTATSIEQLHAIYAALRAESRVLYIL